MMYCYVPKMNDKKSLRTCKEIYADRMGQMDAAARWAHGHRIPGQVRTRPQTLPKRTETGQNGRPFGVARWSWSHDTTCEEATSTSGLKKKGGCNVVPPPQINNECIEKALTQLKGAVMEVGYLLKCILVVLVFFGLVLLVKM